MRKFALHEYRGYRIWPTSAEERWPRWYIAGPWCGMSGGERNLISAEEISEHFATLAEARVRIDELAAEGGEVCDE